VHGCSSESIGSPVGALWTDSNNRQSVVWFYGFEFTPTPINQEDIVTTRGSF
jgi:hypothetical protein